MARADSDWELLGRHGASGVCRVYRSFVVLLLQGDAGAGEWDLSDLEEGPARLHASSLGIPRLGSMVVKS